MMSQIKIHRRKEQIQFQTLNQGEEQILDYQNFVIQNKKSVKFQQYDFQIIQIHKKQSTCFSSKQIKQKQKSEYYRPYIDGLRTIAVSIVIIYHAWPQLLKGGFIGVDIFFVISGYLITGIIIKETQKNKFTYFNFYSRRIRRIFPALLLLLVSVFLFACWKLMKRELQIVTETMTAATIFGANIQLLNYEQDYFDPDLKTNSLMHLWSLGVEEQFYIIWPCVVMSIIKNVSRTKGFYVLIVFTLLSFCSSIYALDYDSKFAFYFPLCRFWQMAIGGIIAYKKISIKNTIATNLFTFFGLLAIMITVMIISENDDFPGYWALVPTISAAMMIIAGGQNFINKYLLSNRLIVFLGKISYPLYLWHWPLLTYSRMLFPPGSRSIFAKPETMIFLTFILSVLTYYLVEKNLRHKKSKKIVAILTICMIIIGSLSFSTNKKPEFFSTQQFDLEQCHDLQNQSLNQQQPQQINKKQKINKQINLNKQFLKQKQKQKQKQINKIIEINQIDKKHIQKPIITRKKTSDEQIQPTQDDYYQKNGIKLINVSKNRKRQPTTRQKINMSKMNPNYNPYFRYISPSSKYYDRSLIGISKFDIINQGKNNTLFLVGDSHAFYLSPRFSQLYKQSLQKNETENFPTIVALIQAGDPYFPCTSYFNNSLAYIVKHKPRRVFFRNFWLNTLTFIPTSNFNCQKNPLRYRLTNPDPNFQINPDFSDLDPGYNQLPLEKKNKDYEDNLRNLKYYVNAMKYLISLGIQVYAAAMNPPRINQNYFDPSKMMDFNGVIQQNVKPIKLSEFKQKNKNIITVYENSMNKIGVKLIHLTDNMCWEDLCEVLTPSGYPIMKDAHHFTYKWSQYWANAVDFLVKF